MKTLFIVSEKKTEAHVGEEYDYILEVDDQPTTETIQAIANQIRTRIRALWMEEVGYDDPDKTAVNPGVICTVDAASPYTAMLIDLQVVLKDAEGIEIELPGIVTNPEPSDAEARRVLGYESEEETEKRIAEAEGE